ncbi:hypothetical protein C3F09_09635 [candidate division GN15 bacterium]|uniref:Uncharacterized protein n=1 Tax=candidate division GN15 bacterium TaxID=2072418 RepID=A0A855WXF4_9BACT|nr:MAG: hypothetical protein C3F09_09635 [candidate division GN15 bacterium]
MNSFRLVKWYLDCVSERGDFIIGYSALLQLGLLKFPLIGQLSRIDGKMENSASLSRRSEPRPESGGLHWHCPGLEIDGIWKPHSSPVRRTLFNEPAGSVVWDCLQPSSEVTVTGRNRCEIRGLGYAERMEVTIAPWKLGLRTLQWGRFVSLFDSVIWILWDGDRDLTMILHNGSEVPDGKIGTDSVSLEHNCRLSLTGSQVIRQGQINESVLSSIPMVRALLPNWLQSIDEQKWLCRGVLTRADGTVSDGWVIHERVAFER